MWQKALFLDQNNVIMNFFDFVHYQHHYIYECIHTWKIVLVTNMTQFAPIEIHMCHKCVINDLVGVSWIED
jgi:hypothetical protein